MVYLQDINQHLKILLLLLLCYPQVALISQEYWTPVEGFRPAGEAATGQQTGRRSFTVDLEQLRKDLATGRLHLPALDVESRAFFIWEDPVLPPTLSAEYPNIRSYSGRSATHEEVSLKLNVDSNYLHAMMIFPDESYQLIDPKSGSEQYDLSYWPGRQQAKAMSCFTKADTRLYKQVANGRSPDCSLRVYRLALAATGEYTAFQGGVEAALAAQAVSLNRINGIFEKELAIRFQMPENNDRLIFTDSILDPYSPEAGIELLQKQNQRVIDSLLGPEQYDLGHLLFRSSTAQGQTDPGNLCRPESKARAATGSPEPKGDAFDIAFLAHELGHQLGAGHTQNNDCFRSDASAYEPGSGSTIMSYAGICSPNVQLSTDAYFHSISLQQIRQFVQAADQQCGQVFPLSNQVPEVELIAKDFTIPQGTPFALKGWATDPDGDSLTYCWEQFDREIAPSMPPRSTFTEGPLFRSFPPSVNAARFFPDPYDWAVGLPSVWEVIPSVARSLNFRLTVRDNALGGGGFAFDSVRIRVVEEAGPFLVLVPNDGSVIWTSGTTDVVRWEVAGTDQGAVNCREVDILLSIDGGKTFDLPLAVGVPNNGLAEVPVPELETEMAAVMIRCADNIFWNSSNALFRIRPATTAASTADEQLEVQVSPNPSSGRVILNYSGDLPGPLRVQLIDLSGRVVIRQDLPPLGPGRYLLDLSGHTPGFYILNIPTPAGMISRKIMLI
jgi:hypothetical protein